MLSRRSLRVLSLAALMIACGPSETPVDAGGTDVPMADGGPRIDAPAIDGGGTDGGGTDGGIDGGGTDAGLILSTGHVRGRVVEALTLDTQPIEGAVISASNGVSVVSAADGSFDLTGIPVGSRVALHVEPPHAAIVYSSTDLIVAVTETGDVRVDARLLRGCSTVLDLAGGELTRALSACGTAGARVGVELPSGGVVNAAGTPVSRVRMEIAVIPSLANGALAGDAFLAFPGDMTALDASGAEVWLESRGAAEVRLYDAATDEPAQLATGRTAILTLPASLSSIEDEAVRIWSYDAAARAWVEEGSAVIGPDSATGALLTRMTVPHFTWWNSDQPATRTCLSGRITLTGAVPVSAATVMTMGVDYAGTSTARVDTDGTFEVFARSGSVVELTVQAHLGITSRAINSVRVETGAPGVCTDLGTVSIDTARLLGCVGGRVDDALAVPVSGAVVVGSQLGRTVSAVTASDGTYCLPLVTGVPAVLYAEATDAAGAILQADLFDAIATGSGTCGGTCSAMPTLVVRAGGCVVGTLRDLVGPVAGALVSFVGTSSASSSRTLSDGTFCAPVRAGDVYDGYGYFRAGSRSNGAYRRGVTVGSSAGSCGAPATCAVADLTAAEVSCVHGVALSGGGGPVAGATVRARSSGDFRATSTVTGADGSYCVPARIGDTVTIEILAQSRTERDYALFTTSVSGPAGTCGGSGCTEVGSTTLVHEVFATCIRGRLLDGGRPARVPIEAATASSEIAILRPRDDGRFCLDVNPGPSGTLRLRDPNSPEFGLCRGDRDTTALAPPTGPVSCFDESGCTDVGDIDFADFCAAS
jgi:hypothetical protein